MYVSTEVETDEFYYSPRPHVLRDDLTRASGEPTAGIVFLHGFSQNFDCAGGFIDALSGEHLVRAVDLPGHRRPVGDAAAIDPFWATAGRIVHVMGRADYIGYSMGGRIALHVALAHPGSVDRLVLIGATAGIEDPAERVARRRSDAELAERMERIGLSAFLDEWLSQPLFSHLPRSTTLIERRLENTVEGLAWSLRNMGTGSMEPLWSRLSEIDRPVLIVAGGDDARYTALGERLVSGIGDNAELAVVAGAGHPVHLEAPTETAELVSAFLERTGGHILEQGSPG